jgi:hypothetical protein
LCRRIKDAYTSLQLLRQTYTDRVLATIIPRNTDMKDAIEKDTQSIPRQLALNCPSPAFSTRLSKNRCSTILHRTQLDHSAAV